MVELQCYAREEPETVAREVLSETGMEVIADFVQGRRERPPAEDIRGWVARLAHIAGFRPWKRPALPGYQVLWKAWKTSVLHEQAHAARGWGAPAATPLPTVSPGSRAHRRGTAVAPRMRAAQGRPSRTPPLSHRRHPSMCPASQCAISLPPTATPPKALPKCGGIPPMRPHRRVGTLPA